MMRYASGSKGLPDTEDWDLPRVVMSMKVVYLQRDVLEERQDHIRSDHTLLMERGAELLEMRKQIRIIDGGRVIIWWKEGVGSRCRHLITSDERR